MLNQLKDLKDTYESVRSQIDRGKEPVEELIVVQNYLKALISDPTFLHEKVDKDYRRFFYDDFTQGLLKRFIRERSRDEKYLDVIAGVLEAFMLLFLEELKSGHFNQQFFDSAKMLFEYDTILHNYNYQIPEDQLKKLRSSNQEWRKELKEGDLVDAIVDENNRCSGWSQARISQIQGDLLHLEFFLDTKNADRFLDRWSVEIAQFETKTKELFDWKKTIQINTLVDAHDKTVWNKSTVLDMKEQQVGPDRTVKMAFIGYRVYVENGPKSDERGTFDGWSSRFDEWIPVYSPKIQPFYSKTQKGVQDDIDLDEDMDNLIKPEEGRERVYAVPRIRKCTSALYINMINLFGHLKGFDIILDTIQREVTGQEDSFDLNIMAILMQCISHPYLIFHKDFISEYGPKFVEICKRRLKDAPEKSLRDVRREKIEAIIKSIDNLQRRLLPKDERERETEVLRLEVSLMCLKSSFLERRIQGIRDLNQIIKNNRMLSNKSFTSQFLVEWMQNNEVFSILFDTKKTHLQLVQRCTDIIKLLLQEDMLSPKLMEMFWSLAKSDYKFEVYKIINDVSFYLKQPHIEYFFEQIKQVAPEKLAMEEFQCLSELGKYAKDDQFKINVSDFFWNIICNSDSYKDELVNNCINKFCEMVRSWDLTKKYHFFQQLTQNLDQNKSSIPSLKLFKGLIKDQKEKGNYSYGNSSPTKSSQVAGNAGDEQQELTLNSALNKLIEGQGLVKIVLNNLKHYCQEAEERLQQKSTENRKKLFLVNSKYSHHDEIDERLQFIKYLATVSDYKISKVELGVIYDLLVIHSKIPSDQEEFLTWCKASCEQSSAVTTILDLNEVGEFFTEKMKSKELDVSNLLLVGFDFLQHYFLSVNEKEQKLIKSSKQQKPAKFTSMNYAYAGAYGYTYGPQLKGYQNQKVTGNQQTEEEDDKAPLFKLMKPPTELDQLDIVWSIALQCKNDKVVPKAIDFLIKIYSQLDEDLSQQRITIQDQLVEKCMNILKESTDEFTIKRVIEIIKHIIYEAEKKGTGDVQPHNALLKGELLERVSIKNKASPKRSNIMMSIYSNATLWEFKKEVAKQLELAPKYLKLEKGQGRILKEIENGKTLGELGFTNNETITAFKIQVEEEVANAPLIGSDGKLTEKAKQIFNEWFDMYSDDTDGMTKETCALFIKGCTGEYPSVNDDRIQNLFKAYDQNQDGRIERSEFIGFYEQAARQKGDTVRDNLRAHNIRADLKKLSEIQEESSFSSDDMPRYKISKNQSHFDLLMKLLDRHDSASEASWNLIQMLATNQVLYKRVLQLKIAQDPSTGKIDWTKFFDSNSVYRLLYTLQIIEAVMEEGEGEGLERVMVVDEDIAIKKKVPSAPPLPGATVQQQQTEEPASTPGNQDQEAQKKEEQPAGVVPQLLQRHSTIVENEDEDKKLRSEWTIMFLENKGFQYILRVFMDKEIKHVDGENKGQFNQAFELKHIAFLLKLLRIFIMAAFSTSNEAQVYAVASLVRKSSISEEDVIAQNTSQEVVEGSRFKELQLLMEGPIGEEIIESIDYKSLQAKILKIIAQVLVKDTLIFEDKLIIENALSLWVSCILHKNELFNEFYEFKGEDGSKIQSCDDFILHGLLFCNQDKIREEFKQSFSSLSHKLMNGGVVKQTPLLYLLRLLSEKFGLITKYHCKQYFELFCELIDHYFMARALQNDSQEKEEAFNPESLLALIIDKIKEYNRMAQEQTQDDATDNKDESPENQQMSEQENIYIGLIQLTGKIIDNFDISFSEKVVEQKSLIDEIFVHFLFASVFKQEGSNPLDNLKIKPKKGKRKQGKKMQFGKKSKDAAYKLLNSLIKKSPLLMNTFLEKSMVPLMKLIKRHDGWNYTPPGNSERSQKYVGLRNLGCICYMNSMLQQFFMIPAFRYNLLCVDDKIKEDLQEYKGNMIDDNVLHQLQKLMGNLELSERQDYNPYEFCFAFKDLDGNPTNTGEQKDAQEFLNLSFDRIENMLKATSRKYLLQSVFGGQTCSQLICQECGKVKNRVEDYYNLSLTVKDIKSMYDSLQKLIEGEVISDYECDGCKKKVDISKRTLISQTPNVLIVHLQRIIFNFDTFRNDKINSFFEFPYQLDLKPYSFYEVMKKENRLKKKKEDGDAEEAEVEEQKEDEDSQYPDEEDCFEYKLVGVNVHSGTANAGHYWSYINTRRGYEEPDENEPTWALTEQDPWMEFNDSTVRDFNFEKLKEECYGGDGKGGSDDAWSFGGSYGKSAYMLVYERRTKRPIKVLVPKEEAEESKVSKEKILFDDKKNEHYKLIDYREGVEDIAPNQIYKQVFEDNMKFEFENDIYSSEFFDFVKGILTAVGQLDKDRSHSKDLMKSVKQNVLQVGRKTVLEILAKCFYNQSIKQIVEVLIEIFKKDDDLCFDFMEQCLKEDDGQYLLELMLECPDSVARVNVAALLKYVLNRLKVLEKDKLYQTESYEVEGEKGEKVTQHRPVALSARFILKCFSELNTKVAKNWSRFDSFLDLLSSFAVSSLDVNSKSQDKVDEQELQALKKADQIGMEFFQKNKFIEKACDFLLGKKSPLAQPGEKRSEMGGSFSQPNFSPIIKLVTFMITNEEMSQKYPLTELEKKMLLHHDLLKVMLGSSSGSKQFGQCLANMCKDNVKLSKKVSKVFIKAINNSNYENVKNYLTALKPFIKLNDSLKQKKLEWVFGFNLIIARKGYREEKYKYGLEFVEKINDEANTYVSPLITGPVEDALLSQLLKCKGKLDNFAVTCLKEMLSLMAKDDDIARFVYRSAPPTYQTARYSDWIRPYLEHQKAEVERSNSYQYFKNKHEAILKSLKLLEIYETKCEQYQQEDLASLEKAKSEALLKEAEEDWLAYKQDEVIKHFPPQLIIGKAVAEDKEFLVYDEDPNVKITIYEVTCEYNYSNPTGWFNLSLPHLELRTNNYQTMSYQQYKKMQNEHQKTQQNEEEDEESTSDKASDDQDQNPQEERGTNNSVTAPTIVDEPLMIRNWFECRKQGPVLLKIVATNKTSSTLKAQIFVESEVESAELNQSIPNSFFSEQFYSKDSKCIGHLQIIDPSKAWSTMKVRIETSSKFAQSQNENGDYSNMSGSQNYNQTNGAQFRINVVESKSGQSEKAKCFSCSHFNDYGNHYCEKCGNSLQEPNDYEGVYNFL